MLLAIDPGAHPGFAVFDRGQSLVACSTDTALIDKYSYDIVVCERPMIYPRSHARPNDIVTLAISAGRYVALAKGKTEFWYQPRQWKGQVDKKIMQQRILRLLWPEELKLVKDANHDVFDAVGIGLFHLKRMH